MKAAKITLFILSLSLLFPSCARQKERMYKKSSIIMDTLVSITVVSDSPEKAESAMEAAFSEIRLLDELLSFWTEDSEIAGINREAGKSPVKVSPKTLDVIEDSMYVSEKTGGAFDPTIGPVIRLWDFKNRKTPEEDALKSALARVNYRMLKLDRDNSTVYLADEKMSFDTGGIAKGYAADMAVMVLKNMLVRAGLVAVAGDIRAFGRKPDGKGWAVGIRNPRPEGGGDDLLATIELKDEAISTSGDYERFFIKDGKRYHHLLDPATGYPAKGCVSVTVIAGRATRADGFSTGVFVMGPEKGMGLFNELGLEGIIIDSEGNARTTEGIKSRVKWKSPAP